MLAVGCCVVAKRTLRSASLRVASCAARSHSFFKLKTQAVRDKAKDLLMATFQISKRSERNVEQPRIGGI